MEQGVAIAAPQDATVHFLHVINVGTEMAASGVGTVADDLTETLEEDANEILGEAEAKAEGADVASERAILEGFPHDAIVEYCSEHDVDLVVMGATGRSGLKEHLLGSTTDRVVRSVDTSVLLARP
ncbi:universal stress protein [Halomicrococcus sp. NG-SE-24]|uniref:universal stress protein n=1 Tax=Halomicrococcus sp. NG-SE-24 TaxID=3436928 RepID=UPI003D97E3AC